MSHQFAVGPTPYNSEHLTSHYDMHGKIARRIKVAHLEGHVDTFTAPQKPMRNTIVQRVDIARSTRLGADTKVVCAVKGVCWEDVYLLSGRCFRAAHEKTDRWAPQKAA